MVNSSIFRTKCVSSCDIGSETGNSYEEIDLEVIERQLLSYSTKHGFDSARYFE